MIEIMRKIGFEILKPYHNIVNYKGTNEGAKFLQNYVENEINDDNKVTHLILLDEEIIGFFSLSVNFDGMPCELYAQAKLEHEDIPDKDMLPLVTVEKIELIEEYNIDEIDNFIKLNIVENINQIYCNYFDGVCIEMKI